jgi:hypothetical protein
LLAYADGSAALTVSTVGSGTIVFANLPLTPDGGDLIGSPMFPAMLHELLRTLRRGGEDHGATPGAAWTLIASTAGEGAIEVSGPDGRAVEAQVVASGRTTRLAVPVAESPGAYVAKQSEAVVGAGVVNVDPRESDTRPIGLENFKPGDGSSVTVMRSEDELLLSDKVRPLWPHLAAAGALFLSLEMLLLGLWRKSP